MNIFSVMVENFMKVFMDDVIVFGTSSDVCLMNLKKVLTQCKEKGLVLNWEKCYFMVPSSIALRRVISSKWIAVDKFKIELIYKQPTPKTVKDTRSFVGHGGFHRRYIQNFSSISRLVCNLLTKDALLNGPQLARGVQNPDWQANFSTHNITT